MNNIDKHTENIIISGGKYQSERRYWMEKLNNCNKPASFPYDKYIELPARYKTDYCCRFPEEISAGLFSLCGGSVYGIFVVLVTGISYLLHKCSENEDILLGVPILKEDAWDGYLNPLLAFRKHMKPESTFKECTVEVKSLLSQVYKNRIYPLRHVFEELGLPVCNGLPAFRTTVLMENIHDIHCFDYESSDMIFMFSVKEDSLSVCIKYGEEMYGEETVEQIAGYLTGYFKAVLQNPVICMKDIDIISKEEILRWHKKVKENESEDKASEERKNSLAEPENEEGEYVAPCNDVEAEMVKMWGEVLGLEKVGVTDNFFSRGGDSIKAIRLAALLWKYGIKVKDLYTYPTISEIVKVIKPPDDDISQEPVEGEVILTPVQRWFFERNMPDVSHYNQSIFLHKKDGFDVEAVKTAFSEIVKHHDALRMAYSLENGTVKQYNQGIDKGTFGFTEVDLSEDADYGARAAEEADKAHAGIDIEKGPLIRLVLFKTSDGDHLLIVIHHLVVDGISWRILLEDFAKAYVQILKGQGMEFPYKTNSYKEWAEKLSEYAMGDELKNEISYWNNIKKAGAKASLRGRKKYEDRIRDRTDMPIVFSEEATNRIKNASNKLNISMDSILLAAIGLSIKEWAGPDKITVDLEGHGRHDIIDNINITRTVGWFTSLYPVIVDVSGESYIDCVRKVNDTLKNIPNKGVGYSILRYLTPMDEKDKENFGLIPEVCFNYLGEFDQDIDNELFGISKLYPGRAVDPESFADYVFDINSLIIGNELRVNINYSRHQYNEDEVAGLIKACERFIPKIIDYEAYLDNMYKNIPVKNVLQGIKPFNEIFYKDCFYNAFFAAAGYLGKDIGPFLANDIFVYAADDKENRLNIDILYIEDQELLTLMNNCGMKVNTVVSSTDIVRDIKLAVAHGRPAIVRVDCYYEPIRRDTYQKKHWPHTLLVYGYDDSQRVFHIMEHSDINALDYTEKEIGYGDIVNCYEGLKANFIVGEKFPTFFEFYPDETEEEDTVEKPYAAVYAQNMRKNKDVIFKRLEDLRKFTEELNEVIFDEISLSKAIDNLSFSFTNILKAKYAEAYRLTKLFGEEPAHLETMKEIIASWKLILNIMNKYKYSGLFREKSFRKVIDRLRELYDMESKHYGELLSLMINFVK